jgi:hypothetical protein
MELGRPAKPKELEVREGRADPAAVTSEDEAHQNSAYVDTVPLRATCLSPDTGHAKPSRRSASDAVRVF